MVLMVSTTNGTANVVTTAQDVEATKRTSHGFRLFRTIRRWVIRVPNQTLAKAPKIEIEHPDGSMERRATIGHFVNRTVFHRRSIRSLRSLKSRQHLHPFSASASAKVASAEPEEIEAATARSAVEHINTAVMRSDTFGHLCDINLHRWIVWCMNRSQLLPRIYIPSTEHFAFGSVHDVSSRIRQYEDFNHHNGHVDAHNWLYSLWKSSVVKHCTTAPVIKSQVAPERSPSRISQSRTIMPGRFPGSENTEPEQSSPARVNDGEFSDVAAEIDIPGEEEDPEGFDGEEEHHDEFTHTGYDQTASTDRVWFTSRSMAALIFLLAVTLRYVIHLAIVLFHHSRSIQIIWCPLIFGLLHTLGTSFTALYLTGNKFAIEDLLISTASFLKPFGNSRRSLILWLPRIYFFINLCFIFHNLFGTLLFVAQSQQWGPFENGTKLTETFGLGQAATPVSYWHLYESYWLPASSPFAIENSKEENPGNPMSLLDWSWIYYLDVAVRLFLKLILVMVKTFFLSISLIVIFKCGQLCIEVTVQIPKITRLNRSTKPNPISSAARPSNRSRGSDSSATTPSPVMMMNRENERLSILTQMWLENIRRYNHIFLGLITIWLLLSITRVAGIIEYLVCYWWRIAPWAKRANSPTAATPTGPTLPAWWSEFNLSVPTSDPVVDPEPSTTELIYRWYETTFLGYYFALELLDIIVLLTVIIVIKLYRHKLLQTYEG